MQAGPVALRLDANEFPSGRFMVDVAAGNARTSAIVTVVK